MIGCYNAADGQKPFLMSQLDQIKNQPQPSKSKFAKPDEMSDFVYAAGIILGISYPILALSTGARALYQLFFKEGVTYYFPAAMSAIAATCYLIATVGFAVRRKWAWWLSVGTLGFETCLTLVVGTLSFIYPEAIGRTVWRHFGADYGYFPLVQPLLGLLWLFHPSTMRAYGIIGHKATKDGSVELPNPTS
jgi:hypothetical protein